MVCCIHTDYHRSYTLVTLTAQAFPDQDCLTMCGVIQRFYGRICSHAPRYYGVRSSASFSSPFFLMAFADYRRKNGSHSHLKSTQGHQALSFQSSPAYCLIKTFYFYHYSAANNYTRCYRIAPSTKLRTVFENIYTNAQYPQLIL